MTEESLRETVSRLTRIDAEQITSSTTLTGSLGGSLGFAKLDAALRSRFGVSNPAIYTAATYGELCSILGLGALALAAADSPAEAAPAIAPITVPGAGNGIRIGVDVESITAMHTAADYREDEFYKNTFTPREIAYAVLQSLPPASFAAMWCAKEALRKADPALAQTPWQRMEVTHDAQGRPSLMVDGQQVAGSLSLSHTDEIAFAVFASAPPPAPPRPSPSPAIVLPRGRAKTGAMLLAALALLISIAAFAVAWLQH